VRGRLATQARNSSINRFVDSDMWHLVVAHCRAEDGVIISRFAHQTITLSSIKRCSLEQKPRDERSDTIGQNGARRFDRFCERRFLGLRTRSHVFVLDSDRTNAKLWRAFASSKLSVGQYLHLLEQCGLTCVSFFCKFGSRCQYEPSEAVDNVKAH